MASITSAATWRSSNCFRFDIIPDTIFALSDLPLLRRFLLKNSAPMSPAFDPRRRRQRRQRRQQRRRPFLTPRAWVTASGMVFIMTLRQVASPMMYLEKRGNWETARMSDGKTISVPRAVRSWVRWGANQRSFSWANFLGATPSPVSYRWVITTRNWREGWWMDGLVVGGWLVVKGWLVVGGWLLEDGFWPKLLKWHLFDTGIFFSKVTWIVLDDYWD